MKRKEEQATKPTPPAIQNLLKKAYELKYQLAKPPGLTRFQLARAINMDPAQLTRFLNLTTLAPRIQRYISALPPTIHRGAITDRAWHRLARIKDHLLQIQKFRDLLNGCSRWIGHTPEE